VTGKRSLRRYLLSGLLTCGKCDSSLDSAARGDTRRYVCQKGPDHGGCGRLTVVAGPVESLVVADVLRRLDSPELAVLAGRAAKDEALAYINDDLAADQAQLQELASAYGDKAITMRERITARKIIEARIELGQRRIGRATHTDALHGLPGNGAALGATWHTLDLTRQAAIVRAVLDHAVIGPGVFGARTLDPERVQPVWQV
jgi:site-specific DNA recombinase